MHPLKSLNARYQGYIHEHFARTKYGKAIAKMKGIHNGESCFIIGNGPSLKSEDLTILKKNNIITFGANRIYNIFDKTDWRPTYYACEDEYICIDIKEKIEKLPIKFKFIPINLKWYKNININSAIYYNAKPASENIRASDNLAEYSVLNGTVTGFFIQLAVYMGFKKIYLIGIDHNFSRMTDKDGNLIIDKNARDHFGNQKNADKNTKGIYNIDQATQTYINLKEFCYKQNVEIFNATRGGKLEVYPRVDFDSLFNKEEKEL